MTRSKARKTNRRVLNVGGNNKAIAISPHFDGYEHILADIDASVAPDMLIDARALDTTPADQFDAIYCSHNLEHYYAHDAAKVLNGFRHVLKHDGFVEVRAPDLADLMRHIVENGRELDDILYHTRAGAAITAHDVIYGWGEEIERSGEDFFAHKMGFTPNTLQKALNAAGFSIVVFRPSRQFEIFALAFLETPSRYLCDLLQLNPGHFPS